MFKGMVVGFAFHKNQETPNAIDIISKSKAIDFNYY